MGLYPRRLRIANAASPSPRRMHHLHQETPVTKLFDLTGKAAIVTGGNGGIGLGIVRGLLHAGAQVAIVARNAEKSRAAALTLAAETGAEPLVVTADVAQADQVTAAVTGVLERHGRIDILFNNAGINIR